MTGKTPEALAALDRACSALNDEGLFSPGDDLCKARRAFAAEHAALRRLNELAIGPAGGVTLSDKREAIAAASAALAAVEVLP